MTTFTHNPVQRLLNDLRFLLQEELQYIDSFRKSHYVAAICWLTEAADSPDSPSMRHIHHLLHACHHLCDMTAWQATWLILSTPIFANGQSTLAEQLDEYRMGKEQIQIYERLCEQLPPFMNGHCHRGLGNGYLNDDDQLHGEKVIYHLTTAAEIFQQFNDPYNQAWTLQALGVNALHIMGNRQDALRYLSQAAEIFQTIEDKKGLGHTLHNLANTLDQLGRYDEAQPLYIASIDALYDPRSYADLPQRAWAHLTYGTFLMGQGHLSAAQIQLRQSIHIFRKQDHHSGILWSLLHLLILFVQQRRSYLATIILDQLTTRYCNIKEALFENAILREWWGWLNLLNGEYEQALANFYHTLSVAKEIGFIVGQANALEGIAAVTLSIKQAQTSAKFLGACNAIRTKHAIFLSPMNSARERQVQTILAQELTRDSYLSAFHAGQQMNLLEIEQLTNSIKLS